MFHGGSSYTCHSEWIGSELLGALDLPPLSFTRAYAAPPQNGVETGGLSDHFKSGQRDWPSRTENVLPCRLLWWQVGFGAPTSGAAFENVTVMQ